MKLLFVVVALVGLAAVASAYQVRRDPCAWGPTYWCKSRTNAQQCRQVHYCRQNFWKSPLTTSVSAKDPTLCDVCKAVVTALDVFLKENTTEAEARNIFTEICNLLGDYESECDALKNEYFEQIYQMFISELNPENVCPSLGLCSNSTVAISGAATPKSTSLKGEKECKDCTKFVNEIAKVMNSSLTKDAAKELAKQVCDLLGPAAPECKLFVGMFFDRIWDLVAKELTPQEICEQLKLCGSNVSRTFTALVKAPFDVECTLCKTLVGEFVKEFVDTNSTMARVMSLIEEACNALPSGEDQQECRSLINSFFPALWEELINEVLTPDNICSLLGVCGNETKIAARLRRSSSLLRRTSSVKAGDPLCDICTEVATALKTFVDGANESQVKAELENLCKELRSAASECTDFVENYFDLAWSVMKQYVDNPQQLCALLGLCNSTAKLLPTQTAVTSDVECELCQFVVKEVDELLSRNATEEEVLDVLENKVCTLLPSSYAGKCSGFVQQYGPTLYQLLVSEVDSNTVCSLIKVCTTSASTSGEFCELCEEVLGAVKSLLPAASDEIVSLLNYLCDLIPSAERSECTDFVNQYGPELIPLIAGLIDPDSDCQMIGLCSKMGVLKMRHRSL